MTEPDSSNPLFNPTSAYSGFRRGLVPLEGIKGYFLQLALQARRETPPEPRTTYRAPAEHEFEMAASGPVAVAVASRSGYRLDAVPAATRYYDPRTQTERFRASLSWKSPWRGGEVDCRLFVLDATVVQKLGVPTIEHSLTESRLVDLFAPGRLADDTLLTRLLSAVPDVDGFITADGVLQMESVTLPDVCCEFRRLPPKTAIVLAIDTDGGES